MTVLPLATAIPASSATPDEPLPLAVDGSAGIASRTGSFADALGEAFGAASASLERADRAEHAFVAGRGGLQEMVLERAQADVALSLAGAAASRVTAAISTILGMQV